MDKQESVHSQQFATNWVESLQRSNNSVRMEKINVETGKIFKKQNLLQLLMAKYGQYVQMPQSRGRISRLSKKSFLYRYLALTLDPRIPRVKMDPPSEEWAMLNRDLRSFYLGLKQQVTDYQRAKYALRDTLSESGLGKWVQGPVDVDLIPLPRL